MARSIISVAPVLLLVVASFQAGAATIHVPADQPTIQAGIDAASDGDTVLVADGTWTGDGNRDVEFGGKTITVRSENGPQFCTIDCASTSTDPHQGFRIDSGEGSGTLLKGFRIINGMGDTYGTGEGGAVHIFGSTLTIETCLIESSRASRGAGIYLRNGSAEILDCHIEGNIAFRGGGIYCDSSEAAIIGNHIIDNIGSYIGGGIYSFAGTLRISGNTIAGNETNDGGGGIFCHGDTGTVIAGNTITNNETFWGDDFSGGGGIFCLYTNSLKIIDNVIAGNTGSRYGGGIDCHGASPLIAGNVLQGNSAAGGGAVRVLAASPVLENNLIIDNHAGLYGGTVHCISATPVINGCTMTGNSAETFAGAVYSNSSSAPVITNSILWGNSPDQIHFIDPGVPLVNWSDVQNGWAGEGNFDADPLFAAGPEGLYYLSQIAAGQSVNSPCVDSGDPASPLGQGTTRTDTIPDVGVVDVGCHFPATGLIVAGPGPGYQNTPLVRVFPPQGDAPHQWEFSAYEPPHHGANVTCGDMDGDALDEILTGAGPGEVYGPHVRGFEVDGTPLPGLSFLAYGTNKFGVNVTAGDMDADGRDEILTGAGPGAVFGPHVRGWIYNGPSGVTPYPGVSYFAYGTPKWGVNVSAGDIDGDGFDEIVTGAGPGAVYGPHVRGWDVDGGTVAAAIPAVSFLAYGTQKFGVNVTCGDVDGDGMDEIVTGAGPGALFGPHVRGWNYDGASVTPLPGFSFFAWDTGPLRFGVNVCARADLNNDGRDELVAGRGPDPDADTEVKVFTYDGTEMSLWLSLEAFPGLTHGTNVAAGRF